MRTLKQIQAARQNGAKSQGPITDPGKARSAQNRLSHGITAGTILLSNENQERFDAIYHSIYDRFHPQDEAERLCVEDMTWAKWRLRRALTYETALLENQLAETQAKNQATRNATAWATLHHQSSGFRNLSRYEATQRRAYTRALEELEFLKNAKLQYEPDTPHSGEEENPQ